MIKIIPFIYNNDPDELLSNTYLLVDSNSSCLVVDPSKNNENIKNYILKNNLTLKGVALTHGHYDHFKGMEILLNFFNVPLYISSLDEIMLRNEDYNCSKFMDGSYVYNGACEYYDFNKPFKILDSEITLLETPYHTKGSVCLYLPNEKILLTGDSLFYHGLGRSDLPCGCAKQQYDSLNKILSLPEDTKVYPGHGPFTSIKEERILNQFVK